MDWRAVGIGVSLAAAYLGTLAWVPGLERTRLGAVALVLATGLVAGASAGRFADDDGAAGRHGFAAGAGAGAAFAAAFWFSLSTPGSARGVFYRENKASASGLDPEGEADT